MNKADPKTNFPEWRRQYGLRVKDFFKDITGAHFSEEERRSLAEADEELKAQEAPNDQRP